MTRTTKCAICANKEGMGYTCTATGGWPKDVVGMHYCAKCVTDLGNGESLLRALRHSIPKRIDGNDITNHPKAAELWGLDDKGVAALTDNHKTNVRARQQRIVRGLLNRDIPTKNEKELARKHPWDLGFSGASWED